MKKTKWHNKNFFQAMKYALNGIKYVYETQRNIIIQSIFAILAIICGILFQINKYEWIILTIAIFFVIVAEFFNTAIETAVDLCTEEINEKAKNAKDVAAGAVLVNAIGSTIIGLIIFIPKIINIL